MTFASLDARHGVHDRLFVNSNERMYTPIDDSSGKLDVCGARGTVVIHLSAGRDGSPTRRRPPKRGRLSSPPVASCRLAREIFFFLIA